MKHSWQRGEDQYLYTGEGLPEGWYVCLILSGETTSGTKVYRISYTTPDCQFVPYIAIKRVGRTERTQWAIHTAKTNAERWIEMEFTRKGDL